MSELLAPAGDFETALAAFSAGAEAVYCGLPDFSARAFAANLTAERLRRLVRFAHARSRKVFVTFNTVLDESDFDSAVERLAELEDIGPDGVIVQDLGVAALCRKHFPRLELHASTQLVAHNLEGVLALGEAGFRRVVLARELSLEEISSIARRCGAMKTAADGRPELELECFIHGALCYSLSGLCLFGAMEKDRSGNRGKCPYCCRTAFADSYPFSMRDLRLGEDARRLVEAGVSSLKIEGRMKSALYVASVTRYYRQILDGSAGKSPVTVADLETVFSRRTTELYFNGRDRAPSPVDNSSLGHLGTEIGVVKRVTKDREGRSWLRFHTLRALEAHDGLQFEAMVDGRHLGMGIREMRLALSRVPVFEVEAGSDVEVALPDDGVLAAALKPKTKVYCAMSNAVKRRFPVPTIRPEDAPGDKSVDLEVTLAADAVSCRVLDSASCPALAGFAVSRACALDAAKNPAQTFAAVEKAFSRLGDTDYRLGRLTLADPDRRFAPMGVLNELRRALVARLDEVRETALRGKAAAARNDAALTPDASAPVLRTVKIRLGQTLPAGDWNEVIVSVGHDPEVAQLPDVPVERLRLALPVYTAEKDFGRLRAAVRRLVRTGFRKWECADLATLRLLRATGVEDISADWTLYAFNASALAAVAALGVKRFVASPENGRENAQYLAESGFAVEFLEQQSTPLFMSLTRPGEIPDDAALRVFVREGLWVTVRPSPRTFKVPSGASSRLDLSWDPEEEG